MFLDIGLPGTSLAAARQPLAANRQHKGTVPLTSRRGARTRRSRPLRDMPRLPRAELEAGIYHVIARGNRKQVIYVDDDDHRRYLRHLGRIVVRMRWHCMAYCLMRNHVHLLVETRVPNLGLGMQRFHGLYAQYFNGRHDEAGHLFGGRFRGVPIANDAHLWMASAYIANNPVNAGLCRSADRVAMEQPCAAARRPRARVARH